MASKKLQLKADKVECIKFYWMYSERQTGAGRREVHLVCLLVFILHLFTQLSQGSGQRAAGIMRRFNVDEAHPAYQSISVNMVCVQTNISVLHSLWFHFSLSDKARLFAWM